MNRFSLLLKNLFAKPVQWNCLCGWHGDTCSWSDGGRTVNEAGMIYQRPFAPICPHCLRRL